MPEHVLAPKAPEPRLTRTVAAAVLLFPSPSADFDVEASCLGKIRRGVERPGYPFGRGPPARVCVRPPRCLRRTGRTAVASRSDGSTLPSGRRPRGSVTANEGRGWVTVVPQAHWDRSEQDARTFGATTRLMFGPVVQKHWDSKFLRRSVDRRRSSPSARASSRRVDGGGRGPWHAPEAHRGRVLQGARPWRRAGDKSPAQDRCPLGTALGTRADSTQGRKATESGLERKRPKGRPRRRTGAKTEA